jgi:outer membrane PBP1 activator LpoA protein
VAEWAARQHPHGRVLILTGNAPWAQRAAAAFEARWNELGQTSQRFAVASNDGQVEPGLLDGLKNRLDIDTPELLFAALDVPELRQVRARIGTTLPCYGGGSINPGRSSGMGIAELDGIHVVDLPWLVLPDHPAVMVYPRPAETEQPLYMQRLYALGIDAFLVARELALHPDAPSAIDGVSGRLTLDPAGQALRRVEATAVYHDGSFNPVNTEP